LGVVIITAISSGSPAAPAAPLESVALPRSIAAAPSITPPAVCSAATSGPPSQPRLRSNQP
jgi:hypothetical protein